MWQESRNLPTPLVPRLKDPGNDTAFALGTLNNGSGWYLNSQSVTVVRTDRLFQPPMYPSDMSGWLSHCRDYLDNFKNHPSSMIKGCRIHKNTCSLFTNVGRGGDCTCCSNGILDIISYPFIISFHIISNHFTFTSVYDYMSPPLHCSTFRSNLLKLRFLCVRQPWCSSLNRRECVTQPARWLVAFFKETNVPPSVPTSNNTAHNINWVNAVPCAYHAYKDMHNKYT